jgi:iron-sulfur cluster assembly protein
MGITLTERAAAHVKRFLAHHGKAALRLGIKPTGCSGYSYVMEPTSSVGEEDRVFESQGIRIIVSAKSLNHLAGTELDYTREGLNERFEFRNPNIKTTCGCGESFNI